MADWSELPKDLLFAIAKCLQRHFDFLRFRSICTTWRASVPFNLVPRPSFCSRLFLRTDWLGKKHFVSMSSICLFKSLAETTPRFWLVKLQEDEFGKKTLVDPLYSEPVQYHVVLDIFKFDVQELHRQYLLKANGVYSTSTWPVAYMNVNSNDEDRFMVMGTYDVGYLSIMKSGEVDSTEIEVEDFDCCEDCIQFKRKFYAIDGSGTSVCVEPHSGVLFRLPKASIVREISTGWKHFMEFCGNLLLIEMIKETDGFGFGFEVFQLDEEGKRWDRLESLGDGILFLGAGGNFSAPVIPGVEGNCIVFHSVTRYVKVENERLKMVIDAFVI